MSSAIWHTGLPDKKWDKKQIQLGAHFLQMTPWAVFQVAQGKQVFYAANEEWSWLAVFERSRFGTRLYCPYGPTATSVTHLYDAIVALVACAKQQQVNYIRVEPQGNLTLRDLHTIGLRRAHRDIQPRLTWVKELSSDEDSLLADMTATNRNLHRTAAKKGISFRVSHDPKELPIFLGMMHEVAQHNRIHPHPDAYYQEMAETLMPLGALKLYIAEQKGQPVASSLIFDSPSTRYYAHAASLFEARKLHPGTPLVSHMIIDAKRNGQKWFDFYGIAPLDQPNHKWAGFTRFKQSFGGEVRDMHGTWELPVKKLSYSLYRTLGKFIR